MTTLELTLLREHRKLPARFRLYTQWNTACTRNALMWVAIDIVVVGLCLMAISVIVA
jgi:hypothetical protein